MPSAFTSISEPDARWRPYKEGDISFWKDFERKQSLMVMLKAHCFFPSIFNDCVNVQGCYWQKISFRKNYITLSGILLIATMNGKQFLEMY